MPTNTYPIIAREGWSALILLGLLALFVKIYISLIAGFIVLVLAVMMGFLLRDPLRTIPAAPAGLVSPIHGRVVLIEETRDIWLKRQAQHMRLRMSPLDIYSLRCPVEGKVMDQRSGRDRDNPDIRQYAFWVRTDEGDDIVVSIRMSWLPRRARLYVQSGQRLGQGQRCGYIYLGGEIDLWLPENVRIEVEPGQQVTSGSMLIAKLVHHYPAPEAVPNGAIASG